MQFSVVNIIIHIERDNSCLSHKNQLYIIPMRSKSFDKKGGMVYDEETA